MLVQGVVKTCFTKLNFFSGRFLFCRICSQFFQLFDVTLRKHFSHFSLILLISVRQFSVVKLSFKNNKAIANPVGHKKTRLKFLVDSFFFIK